MLNILIYYQNKYKMSVPSTTQNSKHYCYRYFQSNFYRRSRAKITMSCKQYLLLLMSEGIIFNSLYMFFSIHTVIMKYTLFGIYFNHYVLIYYAYVFLDIPGKREDSAVSYFNHFRKDFIRPYWLVHDQSSFDARTLSHRLNNINCEFFLRPQIAISEFAETVLINLKYIEEHLDILEKESIYAFIKKTKKIEPYLDILDSKLKDKIGICISFHNKLLY